MTGDIPRIVRLDRRGEEWRLSLSQEDERDATPYWAELYGPGLGEKLKTPIAKSAFVLYTRHISALEKREIYAWPHGIEEELADATLERLTETPIALFITGRSGSGKTTLAEKVMGILHERGISSLVLSTDDYNRGKKEIATILGHDANANWDAHYVYNTARMAEHIEQLKSGLPIPRHSFNFVTSEPHELIEGDVIEPAQVIIVEGIMANSPNLKLVTDLSYLVPTPLATCIGRRVLRDIRKKRAGAIGRDPKRILQYQLEIAEPEYLSRLQT